MNVTYCDVWKYRSGLTGYVVRKYVCHIVNLPNLRRAIWRPLGWGMRIKYKMSVEDMNAVAVFSIILESKFFLLSKCVLSKLCRRRQLHSLRAILIMWQTVRARPNSSHRLRFSHGHRVIRRVRWEFSSTNERLVFARFCARVPVGSIEV